MNIIADTCIWLDALGTGSVDPSPYSSELALLIREDRILMLGLIRQEILSGIADSDRFEQIKSVLRAFPDEAIKTEDHELAADYFRMARRRRIQTSLADCLVCAASTRCRVKLFTFDKHFFLLQKHIPIRLHHC